MINSALYLYLFMYRPYSNKLALSFTILMVSFLFFSCNYKQNFVTEDIAVAQLQNEQRDSLIALVKDLNIQGTTARNSAEIGRASCRERV